MNVENNKNIGIVSKMKNNNLPLKFAELEREYIEFKKNIEKSDFANSAQRYILQRGYEKSLLEMAENFILQDKIKEYSNFLNDTIVKLEENGIKIND